MSRAARQKADVEFDLAAEALGGAGEPGTPAVASVVHAATGRRVRLLPPCLGLAVAAVA